MKKTNRHFVVIAMVIVVASLLLGQAVAMKMWGFLKDLETKVNNLTEELALAEMQIRKNAEYSTKWAAIEDFRQVPVEELQTEFTKYLYSLEANRDFVFSNLDKPVQKPMAGSDEFQILIFTVAFSPDSDLKDLVEFLADLDDSEHIMRIDRMEITNKWKSGYMPRYSPDPSGSKDLSVTITVSIPASNPPAETETVKSTV